MLNDPWFPDEAIETSKRCQEVTAEGCEVRQPEDQRGFHFM